MFIECLLRNSRSLLQGRYVETRLILSHTHIQSTNEETETQEGDVTELAPSLLSLRKGTWNQTHTAWLLDTALLLKDRLALLPRPILQGRKQAQGEGDLPACLPRAEPGPMSGFLTGTWSPCSTPGAEYTRDSRTC